jgi:hypothetical protein
MHQKKIWTFIKYIIKKKKIGLGWCSYKHHTKPWTAPAMPANDQAQIKHAGWMCMYLSTFYLL